MIGERSARPRVLAAAEGSGTVSIRLAACAALALGASSPALCNEPAQPLDRSGRELRGQAAVFARDLAGKRMADGGRFDPDASVAASSTLPLRSTARITNLRNGQVAMVRVRDRIPGTNGRIVNVSPKVAEFLGVRRGGVFPVVVAPLAVPQADGGVLLGAGTALRGRRAYVTRGGEGR
jgi:rare lipoprotein A